MQKKSMGQVSRITHEQIPSLGSDSDKQDEIFLCDQTIINERKKNYEQKKKDLFRKVFRDQLLEKFNRSQSEEEICYESNGDLQPPDFVNELLKSTSSLDSKGISRLRRKEILNQKLDADLKLFEYRKKRTIFGRRPTQRLFKRDDTHYEKPKAKIEEQEQEDEEDDSESEYDSESDQGEVGEKGSW